MIRIAAALLIVTGVLGLVFLGQERWDAAAYQTHAAQALIIARSPETPDTISVVVRGAGIGEPDSGLARIDIPRIGITSMIAAGDDHKSLQRGVGFIRGTARLGGAGNVGLAGHRDTYFRNLRLIAVADTIVITTPKHQYHYVVDWKRVVTPESMAVLAPSDSALLTLVTCYPFYYVGPAPQRFVVRARRLEGGFVSAPAAPLTPP